MKELLLALFLCILSSELYAQSPVFSVEFSENLQGANAGKESLMPLQTKKFSYSSGPETGKAVS